MHAGQSWDIHGAVRVAAQARQIGPALGGGKVFGAQLACGVDVVDPAAGA
ncbi:hypothetical protein [Streptomyces mutabilis]|nr:hypothetical protein [Streptomyces mutabilis]